MSKSSNLFLLWKKSMFSYLMNKISYCQQQKISQKHTHKNKLNPVLKKQKYHLNLAAVMPDCYLFIFYHKITHNRSNLFNSFTGHGKTIRNPSFTKKFTKCATRHNTTKQWTSKNSKWYCLPIPITFFCLLGPKNWP